jgi:hypothetical protein
MDPHWLERIDHAAKFRAFHPHLTLRPSVLRRQVAATFQEDRIGISSATRSAATPSLGVGLPAHGSTWPHSRAVVARDFANVPGDELRAIVHDNAARLCGFA